MRSRLTLLAVLAFLISACGVQVEKPSFLLSDPYPRPEKFDEQTVRLLDVLNPGGGPGNVICEM